MARVRRVRSKKELRAIYAKTQPLPHQSRVVRRLHSDSPRLLAYHSLGSGKTRTALMAAQEELKTDPNKKVLFITPAGLTKNIEKEQKVHGIKLPKKRVDIYSYEGAVKRQPDILEKEYGLIVADEAHKLREHNTKRYQTLKPVLEKSNKLLLLSGSPTYNQPTNMTTLVNLLAKEKVLPDDPKEFEAQHIFKADLPGATIRRLKNTDKLQKFFQQYVDYHEPDIKTIQGLYPDVSEREVKIPLSSDQQKIYKYLEQQHLPRSVRNAVRKNLPVSKQQSKQLNIFATGVRQVSNSPRPYITETESVTSPKINEAVNSLVLRMKKEPHFRGVVYSNYLTAGIQHYKRQLDDQKIPNLLITGALTSKQRQQVVQDYNDGKIKVLLISSAGGEGLDLKGTRLIQVLEPHWNEEKIKQVIGRGVRYKSHTHLPEKERKVEVEHYMSTINRTLPQRIFGMDQPTSIDEYLYTRSKEKGQIHNQMRNLIRRSQQRVTANK